MKIRIILFLVFVSVDLFAQQWSGPSTVTDPITRSGNVSILRNIFGVAQLSISNTFENSGNYSSYWKPNGNIDSQTRLLLSNPNAGTGFTNGLYVGLDQAFANKSYTIGTKDATPLAFYTSGTERLTIAPDGKLILNKYEFGVSELQIANSAESAGNYSSYWSNGVGGNIDSQTRLLLRNPNAGTGFTNGLYVGLDQAYSNKSYTIGSKDATPLGFYSAGSERIRINPDGNVGIGTTAPDAKLAVKGDIHTKEVRVDVTGAMTPDYVFEKDYNLISLPELETYLKQNKHLPEVPSAKEFEAEGMKLKEMNLMLLKKVEELTLYMIEMKKENEAQQKEIDLLKKK